MCKAKKYVEQINSIFEQVKNDLDTYKSELLRLDKTQEDILHMVENENMDAARGYCLAKQLQDTRRERRLIKNELDTLKSLHDKFVNGNDQKVINFQKAITQKDEMLHKLVENKVYNPRVLKEAK